MNRVGDSGGKAEEENKGKKRRVAAIALSLLAVGAVLAVVAVTMAVTTGSSEEEISSHDQQSGRRVTTDPPVLTTTPCNCDNGGICTVTDGYIQCICPSGYIGEYCQIEIDECASDPCQNGGSCQDLIDAYTCDCLAGFDGTNCEKDIDECSSNLCLNGGTCEDGINGYTCSCVTGTMGVHCEINPDNCVGVSDCYGGVCIDGIDSYTCDCNAELMDVAFQKLVDQSSTIGGLGAVKAIDDNLIFSDDGCTHTDEEYEPWWRIDLVETHCINHVIISNRLECCGERIRHAVVLVGHTDQIDDAVQCGEMVDASTALQDTIEFSCTMGTRGRYVTVMLRDTTNVLTLCEVEIYAPGRRRFELVYDDNNWGQANDTCHRKGAHFVKIRNADENNYLIQLIAQHGEYWGWWVGVNDLTTEREYVYADGTALMYLNWRQSPAEPSNTEHEDCAVGLYNLGLVWNDVPCHNLGHYICEYDD